MQREIRKRQFKVIQGSKKEVSPAKKLLVKVAKISLLLFLAFVLGRSFVNRGYGLLAAAFVDTYITAEQVVEEKVTAEGYFIREEVVITAPHGGYITKLKEEGARVGVGKAVVEIAMAPEREGGAGGFQEVPPVEGTPREGQAPGAGENPAGDNIQYRTAVLLARVRELLEEGKFQEARGYYEELARVSQEQVVIRGSLGLKSQVITPYSGIIAYYTDGLETVFRPDNLDFLNYKLVQESGPRPWEIQEDKRLEKGAPLFKVVENHYWYLLVPLEEEQVRLLRDKSTVFLKFFSFPQEKVRASVYNIRKDEEEGLALVIFRINQQLDNFYLLRNDQVEIVYGHAHSVTVPRKALLEKDGESGVYIIENARVRFLPVEVKEEIGEEVLLKDMKPGRCIILNHHLFWEGLRISYGREL